MIGNSVLRKIICSYSLGSISRSNLVLSFTGLLILLFLKLYIVELRSEKIHRLNPVLQLGTFILTCHDDPVGIWVILTAESVIFTCCPPAPLALYVSILSSSVLTCISTSFASGRTATVAVDVWTLPPDSVTGTLWTLWTPLSYFSLLNATRPSTLKEISL